MSGITKKIQMSAIAFLSVCLCIAVGLSLSGGATQARADDVKQLVNVGENASTGAVWVEAGLPETWVGAIDEIRDDTQADGGDVVLRNETTGQNAFRKGEAAWARTSMRPELGAYAVNGLEMRFYLSAEYGAGETLKIVFGDRSGWYLNSFYAFQLMIGKSSASDGSVSVSYKANSNGELYSIYSNKGNVPLYFDYDYFADKASGFENPVGTQNVIRFAADDGKLKLYVNGTEVADLTSLQQLVLTHITNGVYFNVWSQAANGKVAMRITDIVETELAESDTGTPSGYTLVGEDGQISHMLDKMGNSVIMNKESADWDFCVQRNAQVTANDLDLQFRMQSQSGTALSLGVELAGANDALISAEFAFAGANVATVTVKRTHEGGDTVLGTGRVSLYRDGRANRLSLHKTVKQFLTVNGANVSLAHDATEEGFADFGEERSARLRFRVTADNEATLYGITAGTAEKRVSRTLSGYGVENMEIRAGDNPVGYAVNAQNRFRARYIATEVSVTGFSAQVRFGDYGGDGSLCIAVTSRTDGFGEETDAAVSIELTHADAGATWALSVSDGTTEQSVATASATFDWDFDKAHTISFGSTPDAYEVYLDGTSVLRVTGEQKDIVAAAIARFGGVTGQLQFACGGSAVLFYPVACHSFSCGNEAEGWRAGGIGGHMDMTESDAGLRVRFGEGSAVCETPVALDGFTISFRAWHNFDKVEAYIALGVGQQWYRESAGIAFSIAYVDESTARLRVYVTDKINGTYADKSVGSADVPLQWNNGLRNSIALRYDSTANIWWLYCNGARIEGAQYSSEMEAVHALFAQNIAYLQLWGNAETVMEFVDISTSAANTPPATVSGANDFVTTDGVTATADLDKIFVDVDSDTLFYRIKSGDGYVEGGLWHGKAGQSAVIEALDGKGGVCEFTVVTPEGKTESGCGGFAGEGAFAAAVALLALCGAACLCLRKKA